MAPGGRGGCRLLLEPQGLASRPPCGPLRLGEERRRPACLSPVDSPSFRPPRTRQSGFSWPGSCSERSHILTCSLAPALGPEAGDRARGWPVASDRRQPVCFKVPFFPIVSAESGRCTPPAWQREPGRGLALPQWRFLAVRVPMALQRGAPGLAQPWPRRCPWSPGAGDLLLVWC